MDVSAANASHPAAPYNAPLHIRAMFGTIAAVSFLCNGLLCVVILRGRLLLLNSYNVLVFVLAVTDSLTGNMECF